MESYIIYRILQGSKIFQTPKFYGGCEINNYDILFLSEKEKMLISAENFKITIESGINQIISLVIESNSIKSALRESLSFFDEALDVISLDIFSYMKTEISKIGIIKNLKNNEIHPISVEDYNFYDTPNNIGTMFENRFNEFELINTNQLIYEFRHLEIVRSFFRSLHYFNSAINENNIIYKFLNYYLSFEALARFNKNDNIVLKLFFSLNVFCGKDFNRIDKKITNKIFSHKDYKIISKIVKKNVPKIVNLRNKIIHNGLKQNDIKYLEVKKYCLLMFFAVTRLRLLCKEPILNNDKTIEEFWKNYILYFNKVYNCNDYLERVGYDYIKGTVEYNSIYY